jgi:hypothetical protein
LLPLILDITGRLLRGLGDLDAKVRWVFFKAYFLAVAADDACGDPG